jgi:hypothetical protein
VIVKAPSPSLSATPSSQAARMPLGSSLERRVTSTSATGAPASSVTVPDTVTARARARTRPSKRSPSRMTMSLLSIGR